MKYIVMPTKDLFEGYCLGCGNQCDNCNKACGSLSSGCDPKCWPVLL
ncbi:hypothetical protein CCDG5_0172 [[Clostridium] cellulosi]|uniref:Uncharacterized protein n=1 Tax=[Clostridium] cellulosi TaxID=29343 RepID=A0A078KQ82_9FIRM|nr:hypothetical protein CCDG5_0172 [[Clostridium] cellulosi]